MSLFKDKNGQYAVRYFTWNPLTAKADKRIYKTLGDLSYRDAKTKYDRLLHESHKPIVEGDLDLSAACEAYIGRQGPQLHPSSLDSVKRFKATYIRVLGNITCMMVTKGRMQDYVNTRLTEPSLTNPKKKVSPASVKREVAFLKAILNKAVEWDLIPVHMASGFRTKQLNTKGRSDFFFEREELELFWKAFEGRVEGPFIAFFKILFLTGSRISEIINLTWWDVDLKRGFVTIRLLKQREARNKTIPLSGEARAILERLYAAEKNKEGNVFHDWDNKPIKLARLEAMFQRMMGLSGIKRHLTPHSLRHSFASLAVGEGGSIYQVMEGLGHADVSMTQKFYSHLAPSKLQGLVDLVAGPQKSANEVPTVISGEDNK